MICPWVEMQRTCILKVEHTVIDLEGKYNDKYIYMCACLPCSDIPCKGWLSDNESILPQRTSLKKQYSHWKFSQFTTKSIFYTKHRDSTIGEPKCKTYFKAFNRRGKNHTQTLSHHRKQSTREVPGAAGICKKMVFPSGSRCKDFENDSLYH